MKFFLDEICHPLMIGIFYIMLLIVALVTVVSLAVNLPLIFVTIVTLFAGFGVGKIILHVNKDN